MQIPLMLLLLIYLVIVFIFLIFTFFNLYHAWRFGMNSFTNFFTISLYIVALMVIAFFSIRFIQNVDWSQTFSILIF